MTPVGIPQFDGPRLDGRVAIVTGGGTAGGGIGNGKASAILLAQAGAAVVVVDRSGELAEDTVQRIRDLGGQGMALAADVTDAEQCRYIAESTVQNFGRLDILDNNVGIGSRARVTDMDTAEWHRVMQVNVESMMLMSGACIPLMQETAGGGSIINISSLLASGAKPHNTAYCSSKGAIQQLTRAMALDLAPLNIRVNAHAPGWFATELTEDFISTPAGLNYLKSTPAGRAGKVDEMIGPAIFLASEASSFVNGAIIPVDGAHGVALI